MLIENNIAESGQAGQAKKQWVAPTVHVIDMRAARFGTSLNGKDNAARS